MKVYKTITFFLTILLLMSRSIGVHAADNSTFKIVTEGEKRKGQEITVSISAENVTNLGSAEIDLMYDKNKIEYIDAQISDDNTTIAESVEDLGTKIKIAIVYDDSVNGNIPFVTIRFKVLADKGEINLKASGILVDIDTYEVIDVENVETKISVGSKSNIAIYICVGAGVGILIVLAIFLFKKKR